MPEGPPIDDFALLAAWCRGDRGAGSALIERHYSCVALFFRKRASEGSQEDLIQETFLACTQSAVQFRGQAQFRTFLYGIARNVLMEHLRRQSRSRLWLISDAELDELPALLPGPSPVTTAAQHEEQQLLREAMQRIPRPQQVVLELHYWEDLSVAEIGERLGVPLGTAKTRLRNGRSQLENLFRGFRPSARTRPSTWRVARSSLATRDLNRQ